MAKKLANFDSGKHPRGAHGRFTTTPDHSKLSREQLGKARVYGANQPGGGTRLSTKHLTPAQKTKLFHAFLAQRPETKAAFDRLSPVQQGRIIQAYHDDKVSFTQKDNTSTTESTHTDHSATLASGRPRPIKRSELAPSTTSVKRSIKGRRKESEISVTDKGLEIRIAAHDASFRKEADPHFSYDILVKSGRTKGTEDHLDQTITLNDHKTKMYYKGDVVRGVPDLHKDVSRLSDQELFDSAYTAIQETTKGRAPKWIPETHGSVPDSLVGQVNTRGTPNYMGMQIHHNDQWAKNPARQIEADFAAGRITADERRWLYLENLRRSADNANGWEIDVRSQEHREFIILAGGLHQFGTPLFESVHPHMLNPGTGEMEHMSIPKGYGGTGKPTAEGRDDGESRAWFDARFRSPFWKEYYKDQASILAVELQKRVASGAISNEAANNFLQQAKANYDKAEELRKREPKETVDAESG